MLDPENRLEREGGMGMFKGLGMSEGVDGCLVLVCHTVKPFCMSERTTLPSICTVSPTCMYSTANSLTQE